jgi:hypothetical protein
MVFNPTIQTLAIEEDRLLTVVEQARGLLEEKTGQLDHAGVFDQYRAVHTGYARLLTHSDDGLEALKRAIFLQWIAQIEPSCYTGVREVETAAAQWVIAAAQRRLADGPANTELAVMLRWYDSLTGWYFGQFAEMAALQRHLVDGEAPQQLADVFTEQSLANRGQMGQYWRSVLRSQSRQNSTP